VLLMGDAEAAAEDLLLQRYSAECLSADLLKAGHHGASTSTSDALLDAVSPRFVAVSCGYGNTFGHPARRVVDALAARGIAVGRTDREGTLIYCSDGKRLWRKQ
ncbi:MAG: DNA internalization-related competence protein ComEC/Rec2, partial [Clostridia bacterium]|nr:DNA internalization-related competence protein ComEC/Rec2 [Clostridia bacterium]